MEAFGRRLYLLAHQIGHSSRLACGGLMFGYDIGISGGVTSMDDFLIKFFRSIYEKEKLAKGDYYCRFDNHVLTLFTSSLYLAALVSTFFASKFCSKYGRKCTILLASLFCILGVGVSAGSVNIVMLIIGRVLLGMGVGFGNEAVPVFLSEIAPIEHRGAVTVLFQLFVSIGILCANIVNWWASRRHPWGWRLALGLAGVPALMLFLGSIIIPETPISLIERGRVDEGRRTLEKIRQTHDIEDEYKQIVRASHIAKHVENPLKEVFSRSNRPPLVIGIALPLFQQSTGINAIIFYAPVLFKIVGFRGNASLLSSAVIGSINVVSTLISSYSVDKWGRRLLLLEACVQMLICQLIVGIILQMNLKAKNDLSPTEAKVVLVLVCVFVMGFAWSWGPLGWLIPSEIFPLETRTIGFAFSLSSNMLFIFVGAQLFLTMLCHLKAGIFFFFAACIFVMALFVAFLLPETKNVPIHDMVERVWKQHWYWKRFMDGPE